jgi:Mg2+/citrate symporter
MTDEQFEAVGAAEVRARVVTNVYLGATRLLALAWLERRSEASNAEQLDIARSAKEAAWAAAQAAETANNKAKIAIAIAIISLIVAIVLGVIPLVPKH